MSTKKHQCAYRNNRGHECTHDEVLPGILYCNLHLNRVYNVQIKKSGIPNAGFGLFAGSNGYKKGDIILEYSRNDIRIPQIPYKCENASSHKCSEYIYCDDNELYCWDGRYRKDIIARYSNDSRSASKNNAYFENYRNRSFIIADRNIRPFHEIFTNYGPDYDWSFLTK